MIAVVTECSERRRQSGSPSPRIVQPFEVFNAGLEFVVAGVDPPPRSEDGQLVLGDILGILGGLKATYTALGRREVDIVVRRMSPEPQTSPLTIAYGHLRLASPPAVG